MKSFFILAGKNIEFSFSTVGRLTIRNGKVKMRFYKDFLNCLEGSEEIINAMRDVSIKCGYLISFFVRIHSKILPKCRSHSNSMS